ncbi:MAG: discoidin domain-containing protein, partial [Planctomycetes bacterium]|nr:discoidin domain-containing protein [Planctomycetota bacterium]
SLDGETWKTAAVIEKTFPVKLEPAVLVPNRPTVLDFPLETAVAVRVVIHGTNNGAPCIDELEVYGDDAKRNLATGARATASSTIQGHAIHRVEHLNDGRYGNAQSWICGKGTGWAQVTLPETTLVGRVVLSRDREGKYRDRLPTDFEIQVSPDGRRWNVVKRVGALGDVAVDRPLEGESAESWAARIVLALSASFEETARTALDDVQSLEDVQPLLELYRLDRRRQAMAKRIEVEFNPPALRRAVADLTTTFPDRFRPPDDFERALREHEARLVGLPPRLAGGDVEQVREALVAAESLLSFQREVLLANPVLDFKELLLLKRKTPEVEQDHTYWQWGQKYGFTVNWSSDFRPKNPSTADYWDDEIVALEWADREGDLRTVLKPPAQHMLQHPDLDYDARRLLVSMPGAEGAFQVFEVNVDGSGLRRITRDTGPDVDNGDACYLPDGRILFNSTRAFTGVPCEDGQSTVSNLCLTDADGVDTRMLTFDQESNWHPSVLNNGRVLYTRYEYANVSHQFGRLLFHMNPDGTSQAEYYGSNSYWPNSIFHARPVPEHPTRVVGVVCGHHGPNKTGRLVLFDPARGRHETSGAVQTIPGYGQPVERIVEDYLYGDVWPKFVHPWPLSDKYFLVSARLDAEQEDYAIYLVDVFDNVTEVFRLEGYSLLEPIPLRARPRPPVVADRVKPDSDHATVFLADVYAGKGLRGVPRGTVESLRLFTYNYLYRETLKRGFQHLATPGVDGPWEPRYLLGTVPVRDDGSAVFQVPANTPISVQPLNADGQAVQLMRSWFTAMPGEVLSCVGCHEDQNTSPLAAFAALATEKADKIQPWRGQPRGFDFEHEVQPVLDRFCVGCHDGSKEGRPDFSRKSEDEKLRISQEYHARTETNIRTILTPSFIALHPYVRRPHAESHYGMQVPGEYLADSSPLVQMLEKGHHNVRLDDEARDRLCTWIDLGAPDHGSWKYSEWGVSENYYRRRLEMLREFAGREDDVEALPPMPEEVAAFVLPAEEPPAGPTPPCPDWPFDASEAERRRQAVGLPREIRLDVAGDAWREGQRCDDCSRLQYDAGDRPRCHRDRLLVFP